MEVDIEPFPGFVVLTFDHWNEAWKPGGWTVGANNMLVSHCHTTAPSRCSYFIVDIQRVAVEA